MQDRQHYKWATGDLQGWEVGVWTFGLADRRVRGPLIGSFFVVPVLGFRDDEVKDFCRIDVLLRLGELALDLHLR